MTFPSNDRHVCMKGAVGYVITRRLVRSDIIQLLGSLTLLPFVCVVIRCLLYLDMPQPVVTLQTLLDHKNPEMSLVVTVYPSAIYNCHFPAGM